MQLISSFGAPGWPGAEQDKSRVEGNLADRIRTRFGVSPDMPVFIIEDRYLGGYSEWTLETTTTFTIECGGKSVEFHPDSGSLSWSDLTQPPVWRDSVFARFDEWLAAAERPEEKFSEWLAEDESCEFFQTWKLREDTVLYRAATQFATRQFETITLIREPHHADRFEPQRLDEVDRRQWMVRFIAATDERGFRAINQTIRLDNVPDMADSGIPTREVVLALSDAVLRGRERL